MTVTATIHTPPPEPQSDRRVVTLTMPYDVAVTLRALLGGHVTGHLASSYMAHTNQVWAALVPVVEAGIPARFSDTVEAKPLTK